jgi:hypothetical protein
LIDVTFLTLNLITFHDLSSINLLLSALIRHTSPSNECGHKKENNDKIVHYKKSMPIRKEHLMDRSVIFENTKEQERLIKLAGQLSNPALSLQIYKEGWTVAVIFAHLAFWDQWALILMRLWKKTGVKACPIDTNSTNDSLLPFLQAHSLQINEQ